MYKDYAQTISLTKYWTTNAAINNCIQNDYFSECLNYAHFLAFISQNPIGEITLRLVNTAGLSALLCKYFQQIGHYKHMSTALAVMPW